MKVLTGRVFMLVGLFGFLFLATAHAVPVGYTDHATFSSALPGTANVLDFESMAYGDTIASGDTIGGVTLTYDFGGVQMMATDDGGGAYPTTSGSQYLGTTDGDVFLDGDFFDLSFSASNAIGIYFITEGDTDGNMFDDDISMTAGKMTIGLDTATAFDLSNGWYAYFLGIIDTENTFTEASITTVGGEYFLYNVDDITTASTAPVPEPATILLFGAGLTGLAGLRRKTNK